MTRALTAKQERFILEYLVDLNATKAAARSGYSLRTARVIGQENLLKPAIKQAIEAAIMARSVRVGLEADDVVRDLKKLLHICMGYIPAPRVVNVDGKLVECNLCEFDASGAAAALDKLMKHLGVA